MALIHCPECGKEISDKANICIHCGFPLEMKDTVNVIQSEVCEADDKQEYTIELNECEQTSKKGKRRIKTIFRIFAVIAMIMELIFFIAYLTERILIPLLPGAVFTLIGFVILFISFPEKHIKLVDALKILIIADVAYAIGHVWGTGFGVYSIGLIIVFLIEIFLLHILLFKIVGKAPICFEKYKFLFVAFPFFKPIIFAILSEDMFAALIWLFSAIVLSFVGYTIGFKGKDITIQDDELIRMKGKRKFYFIAIIAVICIEILLGVMSSPIQHEDDNSVSENTNNSASEDNEEEEDMESVLFRAETRAVCADTDGIEDIIDRYYDSMSDEEKKQVLEYLGISKSLKAVEDKIIPSLKSPRSYYRYSYEIPKFATYSEEEDDYSVIIDLKYGATNSFGGEVTKTVMATYEFTIDIEQGKTYTSDVTVWDF